MCAESVSTLQICRTKECRDVDNDKRVKCSSSATIWLASHFDELREVTNLFSCEGTHFLDDVACSCTLLLDVRTAMSSSQPFLPSSPLSLATGRRRKSRFTYRHIAQLALSSTACPLRVVAHIDLDAFYAQCEMIRLGVADDQPLAVQQWYVRRR